MEQLVSTLCETIEELVSMGVPWYDIHERITQQIDDSALQEFLSWFNEEKL